MARWFIILILVQTIPIKCSSEPEVGTNRTNSLSEYRFISDESAFIKIEFQWNPALESWINLHIRICGAFCNGTEYIELSEATYPICDAACFPCDCDVTCPIYGTCCPNIDANTPLAEKDRRQYKYSESYAPVYFVGNLMDYDFVDKNSYKDFVIDNPDLGIDSNFSGRFSCLTTSYVDGIKEHHYAIADCPDEMKNKTVGKLCELDDLDIMTLDTATPVTDLRSGIVFKNRYCLQCNIYNKSKNEHQHISDRSAFVPTVEDALAYPYQIWNLGIFCAHYQRFYMLESSNAFLRAVMKDVIGNIKSPCMFRLEPPHSRFPPRICRKRVTEESPVGKVHPTGDCIHDSGVFRNIRHFCHSLTAEAYRIYQRQNVFCYMCVYDFPNCNAPRWSLQKYVTSHLSFLLGESSAIKTYGVPERHDEESVYLCEGPHEWMDKDDNCQNPECVKGKQLRDGTCESIVKLIETLGYKVTVVLRPLQDVMKEEYAVQFENHLMMNFFILTNTTGSLDLTMAIYGKKDSDRENFIEYILVSGHLVSSPGISRDDFENNFLNQSFQFHVNANQTNNDDPKLFSLSAVYIGSDMLEFLRLGRKVPSSQIKRGYGRKSHHNTKERSKNSQQHGNTVMKGFIHKNLETVTADVPIESAVGIEATREKREVTIVNGNSQTTFSGNQLYPDSIWNLKRSFIDLTHSLICPYVSFDIRSIHSTPKFKEIYIDFKYRGKNYSLDIASSHFRDSVSIVDLKIRICIDMFRNEYQHIKNHYETNSTFTISVTEMAKRYFALACFLLSAFCLCLTIASYALLPQLRTLPGLNTLMLSISLAIAQIFLVVVVELVGYIHGWLCMGLGMGLHFSWLVAFQWMSVCCYHMFSVFRGHQARLTPISAKHKFEWYSFYVYGSSAVIVCLTILASEMFSNSKSTGYSQNLCVFDSEWSYLVALLSFVIPLALISFSNLVMFLITVREIMAVTSLQATGRMKGKHGVATYCKLSSLTGIFWFLTILAAFLNNIVLDFISIPFVALQGVFVFFSFTLNTNTKNLLSQMRGKSQTTKASNSPAGTRVSLIIDEDDTGKTSPAHV